jgi:hypothetical protein
MNRIYLEKHLGVNVLRDDLLPGGTKSVLMPYVIGSNSEYVYATPVYGGFQIALAAYCNQINKKATIFCAKRKERHPNTNKVIEMGGNVIEVPYGYLSVIEKRAREYCEKTGAEKLTFGANTERNKNLLTQRVIKVINHLENEPKEIWCAIGSGTLVEAILQGTKTAKIYGVQVGKEYKEHHPRLTVLKYDKGFEIESNFKSPFPSMPNYDLKAFEYCTKYKKADNVLFWNVL